MLVVFTEHGDQEVDERPCFIWHNLPTFEQLRLRMAHGRQISGILLDIDIELPMTRINLYSGSNGRVGATYDGRTLVVDHPIDYRYDPDDDDRTFNTMLEMCYKAVTRMFFEIVHGQINGLHDITPSADPGRTPGTD